jgi:hypothetical protein
MELELPAGSDICNRAVDWAVSHFWDEAAAVQRAPLFFAVSVVIVVVLLYLLFRWRYAETLESKNELIGTLISTRDDLKMRLDIVSADWKDALARINELNIPEHDSEAGRQIEALKKSIVPKLNIEFEQKEGFFFWATAQNGGKSCYVRVLPRPSAVLANCKGFLESIERLENGKWISVGFASRPQLHWAEIHETGVKEVELLTNNSSQFLDVAFVRTKDNSVHLAVDQLPSRIAPLFVQYPNGIFKFCIGMRGTAGSGEIVESKITLQFQQAEWGQPPAVTKL